MSFVQPLAACVSLNREMADNGSLVDRFLSQRISSKFIIAQSLVCIFLCINMLLIMTFFKKESFHTSARYILFALLLLSDSLVLIISDLLFILNILQFHMQVWLCLIISAVLFFYAKVTPVTLTVMTLECYVAVCMPLRHAQLCSTRRTMYCIFIIHGFSSFAPFVILSIFFALASLSFYKENKICSVEMFILKPWQDHLRSAVSKFYFLIIGIIIMFCYYKIMKVAKAASGENKKSTKKGLRTVTLHAFQLLLCLIRLWCPFIEAAVFHTDFNLFLQIRYFNYIMFTLAPKCLSSLIYGLRDEKFFLALKNYVCCSFYKRNIHLSYIHN